MLKIKNTYVFYFVVVSYILLNAYVLLFDRSMFYVFNLLPGLILILLLAIFDIEKILYLMVFSAPLAIGLKEMGYYNGLDMSMPTEPLMIGITLIYFLNEISHGITDTKFFKHPITIIILLQMSWALITTFTSELPIISIKFLLSRTWFITSCYFMASQLFKNKKNIYTHLILYAFALAIVAIITTAKHASFGFDEKTADWIVSPFYNDHTAYGSALAMYIPIMFAMLIIKNISKPIKILCFLLLLIFLISIVLSYARAGWLSLLISLGVLLTIIIGIKFRTILITLIATIIIFASFQSEILMTLGRNNTDSDGDFMQNIESITNISTDVSNVERLNRWSCAIRIFQEYPFFGTGPGTFQFLYAPYQKSNEKTIISTNFGNKGNAHSEYLGPLSEQGIFGGILIVVLVFATMFMGYRLAYNIKDKSIKILSIAVLMGMSTYFVHGFLNNFLEYDKASVPFYGFLAILVCIDLYYKEDITIKN